MTQRIKLTVDLDDGNPPEHITVDATDRISIVKDDFGISVRSDGDSLELSNKVSSVDIAKIDNFVNQMSLFDSKPWKMEI
jgi:hypothetical protein